MTELDIAFWWHERGVASNYIDSPGRWTAYTRDRNDASVLHDFLRVDLGYRLRNLEECIHYLDVSKNDPEETSELWSGTAGAAAYGNGHVLLISHHDDDDRLVMADDQFLLLLERVRQSMKHPDYRNPDNNPFQPFTINIIATGANALDEYYKRGGITPIMPGDQ